MRFQHGELHLALLALLKTRPMHGYELMGELGKRIGRRYKPSPGSIYPAVTSLEAEGLISARIDGDRRIYELTADGGQALEARLERLVELEARIGASFGENSTFLVVARFAERARSLARSIDASALEALLDRTLSEIETMVDEEGSE